MSVEERIQKLLSANPEHLPLDLKNFSSRKEATLWLKSKSEEEIGRLMYELVYNQMPNQFDREQWIQMFINANYFDLPVVVRDGISKYFADDFSKRPDETLISFVQTVVLNQLQEVSAKLINLAVEYEQDDKMQTSKSLQNLATRISAYAQEFQVKPAQYLLEDLQAMKAQIDSLLPRSLVMGTLDKISTEVDELSALLSESKV